MSKRDFLRTAVGTLTLAPLVLLIFYGLMIVTEMFPKTLWIMAIGFVGFVFLALSRGDNDD